MSEENIENITIWESNFAPTFVDYHLLLDVNFNGHCLIQNNNSYPWKSNKPIYFLHTRSTVKTFKHRFYTR